jgi:GtrA-like protein
LSGEGIARKDGWMDQTPAAGEARRNQHLRSRIFWFLAGAGVNYLLISTPFKWLKTHTGMANWAVSACSFGVSTSFFFVWNYFINFRTDARKRDALARYLTAVLLMWAASSAILTGLKHFDLNPILRIGRYSLGLDRDIIATQFCLSGLKFFLYHKWVFPLARGGGDAPAA